MLRTRTLGLAVVAAFALSAVVASAAFAAKPEFKGPFPTIFTSTSGSIVLETHDGSAYECEGSTGQGQLTGPKEGNATIKWTGCRWYDGSCQSAGANPEEIVLKLSIVLGYIDKAKGEVGVLLEPKAGKKAAFAEYACLSGSHELPVVVKGGVIGALTPINTKTDELKLGFRSGSSKGEQSVTQLEGKAAQQLETSINEGSFEKVSMETNDTFLTEGLTEVAA